MELAPANVPVSFEVTYSSPSLPVGLSVYDTTTDTPVLVQAPLAMTNVPGTNTYVGNFTGENNKNYLILKAVYTDDTLTTIDTAWGQGSETITTEIQGGGGGGGGGGSSCIVTGYIVQSDPVVGFIDC
jgi:hypothetical protein